MEHGRAVTSAAAPSHGWARACAALCVVVACAVPALAQDTDPRSTARARLGPFYVTPIVTLRDIGIDTNVYNESVAEPVKDFAFTLQPALSIVVGPRRANLTVRSTTDVVYFAKQRSERSVNEDVAATVQFALGRLRPFADVGYLNTRQRVTEEIDARARRVERRGGVGLGVDVTPKVSAQMRADVWKMAFDADAIFDDHDLATELDRETETLTGDVRYALTPLTAVVVAAERTRARFVRAAIRNTDTQQMRLGVELNPRALIAGTAHVGYQWFRPTDPDVPTFTGLVGSAAVSYGLRQATTFGFIFDRTINFSYLAGEPYYVRQSYGVSVRRQLTPRWDVELSGDRTWHRYRRLLAGPGDDVMGHVDRLLGAGVTVGHDFGPRTRITAGVTYQDRVSDFSDRRFRGLRLGTSIAYGF